jgi:peptidoglycan glycosyltransferase
VAGKTGTAQWGVDKESHAWFAGFAPYENPEIAITILFEEGGEGSDISVPVAHQFFYWYFTEYK